MTALQRMATTAARAVWSHQLDNLEPEHRFRVISEREFVLQCVNADGLAEALEDAEAAMSEALRQIHLSGIANAQVWHGLRNRLQIATLESRAALKKAGLR